MITTCEIKVNLGRILYITDRDGKGDVYNKWGKEIFWINDFIIGEPAFMTYKDEDGNYATMETSTVINLVQSKCHIEIMTEDNVYYIRKSE